MSSVSDAHAEAAATGGGHPSRFAYGGQMAASLTTDRWRAAAASVAGPSHVRRGAPCEDAAAAGAAGEWLAAVVCDGAGNARFGGRGAEIAAERIVAQLLARLDAAHTIDERDITQIITDVLSTTREGLVEIAAAEGVDPPALSATVVGAVSHPDLTVLFQIGDGAALAFDANGALLASSLSHEQEYANETWFLTDATWRTSLQVQMVSGLESFLLMTDGVTPFALDLNTPKPVFTEAVLGFLRACSADRGALALQRLLDKPDAHQVSDDKTLLWGERVTPRSGETHGPGDTVAPASLDR
jgi:hypothetical protein